MGLRIKDYLFESSTKSTLVINEDLPLSLSLQNTFSSEAEEYNRRFKYMIYSKSLSILEISILTLTNMKTSSARTSCLFKRKQEVSHSYKIDYIGLLEIKEEDIKIVTGPFLKPKKTLDCELLLDMSSFDEWKFIYPQKYHILELYLSPVDACIFFDLSEPTKMIDLGNNCYLGVSDQDMPNCLVIKWDNDTQKNAFYKALYRENDQKIVLP